MILVVANSKHTRGNLFFVSGSFPSREHITLTLTDKQLQLYF